MDDLLKYAHCALLSYNDDLNNIHDNFNVKPHKFINKSQAQCWIFKDNAMIVCFRGTDSLKDILINLKCFPHPFYVNDEYCGIVHRGYWEYYNSLREDVMNEIRYAGVKKVVFVGHSLGGCVMLMALECALQERQLSTECYTFGSPGVGDMYFEHKLVRHTRVLNVKYDDDLITKINISKHVTRELVLRSKTRHRIPWLHQHNMGHYVQGVRDRMRQVKKRWF